MTLTQPRVSTVESPLGKTLASFMRRATIMSVKATPIGMPSGMKATTHPMTLLSMAMTERKPLCLTRSHPTQVNNSLDNVSIYLILITT